jgi:hypothetical protein
MSKEIQRPAAKRLNLIAFGLATLCEFAHNSNVTNITAPMVMKFVQ